jgi:hypothetical protein
MTPKKIKYIRRHLSINLQRLGFTIAAENVLELTDIEDFKLYLKQVLNHCRNWPENRLEIIDKIGRLLG